MKNNQGKLFLIPTPIGNLLDESQRAINALNSVDYIACEDTRNTQKLLQLLNIKNKTISCHEFNELEITKKIIFDILEGKNVGYCSDAGLPCISDPGYILVKEAIKNNIVIEPIPGPNAGLTALIASGFPTSSFEFIGFLDPQISKKEATLAGLLEKGGTFIVYESPHKIEQTLKSMQKVFGNIDICIARELTKLHEDFLRFNLSSYKDYLPSLIGEMVIIFFICKKEDILSKEDILDKFNKLTNEGLSEKDAIKAISILFKSKKNYIKDIIIASKN